LERHYKLLNRSQEGPFKIAGRVAHLVQNLDAPGCLCSRTRQNDRRGGAGRFAAAISGVLYDFKRAFLESAAAEQGGH